MPASHDDRPRGVTLHLIDFAPLLAEVPLTDEDRAAGHTAGVAFAPYAMIEHGGRMFVICGEGVGWEVSDDAPLEIDIFRNVPDHIALMPTWQATLSPARVRELTTDQEIDLADLVRRFGSRLETNFWMWHRTLTRKAVA